VRADGVSIASAAQLTRHRRSVFGFWGGTGRDTFTCPDASIVCGLAATVPERNAPPGFRDRSQGAKLDRHIQVNRWPLTSLQTMRRFGPWLLGLFLIAQLAGVVPVMFDHAVHVFESQPAVASAHDHSASSRHGDHRHGIADVKDECCSLHHHLAGVLPFTVRAVSISFAAVRMVVPPARALASADPILLERPPKSSSLI
jgi:hypothetical protein